MKDCDYTQSAGWFVTVCTHERKCLLGEIVGDEAQLNALGKIVEECWLAIPKHFPNVMLGEYVVMPNHIHGLLEIDGNSPIRRRGVACNAPTETGRFSQISPKPKSLGVIIRSFKSAVTKHVNEMHKTPNAKFWQRNYYEHGVRNDADLERIRKYIKRNPMNWNEDEENKTT